MVTTQEELQACFDQTLETGDFAPVMAGLKELTGIKSVHQITLDYFEQLRLNAVPNHPFYITQWADLGKHCYTYHTWCILPCNFSPSNAHLPIYPILT